MRWLRLIRLHQWAKNGLLLVPALAAHLTPTPERIGAIAAAVGSFCLLSSAVYILNDLADLEHDRLHPVKKERPVAAGRVSTRAALGIMALFAVLSLGLAVRLPFRFLAAWVAYLVLTTGYSFLLKRVVVLDVVILAALYTVRVVAGAAALTVPLSRWFLAFGVFVFFSLALLKRLVEVMGAAARGETSLSGRGWAVADLTLLRSLGVSSAVAAALVYCLYITGEPARQLYTRPDLLWVGLPVLLYWVARIWLLANRGEVDDDPVVFALRDGASYGVLLIMVLMVVVAA